MPAPFDYQAVPDDSSFSRARFRSPWWGKELSNLEHFRLDRQPHIGTDLGLEAGPIGTVEAEVAAAPFRKSPEATGILVWAQFRARFHVGDPWQLQWRARLTDRAGANVSSSMRGDVEIQGGAPHPRLDPTGPEPWSWYASGAARERQQYADGSSVYVPYLAAAGGDLRVSVRATIVWSDPRMEVFLVAWGVQEMRP